MKVIVSWNVIVSGDQWWKETNSTYSSTYFVNLSYLYFAFNLYYEWVFLHCGITTISSLPYCPVCVFRRTRPSWRSWWSFGLRKALCSASPPTPTSSWRWTWPNLGRRWPASWVSESCTTNGLYDAEITPVGSETCREKWVSRLNQIYNRELGKRA